MENLTGKQFGPYQVVAPLGEGGMAAVYKGYQPGIDRYVALKVLPRQLARDPQFIKRFEQEAKVLAKLQHPHILPIHDYGQVDAYTYIVMPFIESGDLTDILQARRLALSEIGRIIGQVGDALDYAHTQGVIHRDVKPSNILVDQRVNCLLTDFGIAKMVEGTSNNLTATGGIIGTPTYMSPEQGAGKPLDGRSDIYALGVILYQMITGRVPFRAETPMAVMIKHMNDPLLPPREFNETLPEAIERVILKSLAKQPEDRYATAGEMVKALQTAVTANPIETPVVPLKTHLSTAGRANGQPAPAATPATATRKQADGTGSGLWLALAGVLLVLFLGILGVGGWWWLQTTGAPPPSPPPTQQAEEAPPPAAAAPPTETPALALPQPTATPVPAQPTATPTAVVLPTQPASDNQAAPAQPPTDNQQGSGQPPAGGSPPQEAIQVCAQASAGAACQFEAPGIGTISGTCQQVVTQELACVPQGGPPGPRN